MGIPNKVTLPASLPEGFNKLYENVMSPAQAKAYLQIVKGKVLEFYCKNYYNGCKAHEWPETFLSFHEDTCIYQSPIIHNVLENVMNIRRATVTGMKTLIYLFNGVEFMFKRSEEYNLRIMAINRGNQTEIYYTFTLYDSAGHIIYKFTSERIPPAGCLNQIPASVVMGKGYLFRYRIKMLK